jgi:hypothetical protein
MTIQPVGGFVRLIGLVEYMPLDNGLGRENWLKNSALKLLEWLNPKI